MSYVRSSLSLLEDRYARRITYVRVSVTDRCNYRCVYCMPAGGVPYESPAEALTNEEWVRLIGLLARFGVRRVRITGGEPLVRRGIVELVEQVRGIAGIDEVMLTTNGHLLEELAAPLARAGLGRINLSLDSLDAATFKRLTRGGDLPRVMAGARAAQAAGLPVKLNAVVVGPDPADPTDGGNVGELGALARAGWELGGVTRFIEVMPMGEGRHLLHRIVGAAAIRTRLTADLGGRLEPTVPTLPGAGPARYWRHLPDGPVPGDGITGPREIGIISAMTEEFCAACNRVRISAKGSLRACLASDDEAPLAELLRRGDEQGVIDAISLALHGKRRGHQFTLDGGGAPDRAMSAIGG
jgi:cyclic pyranopterin phosphate synthase